MKSNTELIAGAALDYSKAAFTVLFLGGLAAYFLKPDSIPTPKIYTAIAVGLGASLGFLGLACYLNHRHNKRNNKLK
ncbi:MAG: hypothetical protein LBT73_00755 [Tannerellaceae bacterium]|nr:hypothetical protein [Tannerellaceae bacterium]